MKSDQRQKAFSNFVVPDQGRISKVYDWLARAGRFDGEAVDVLEIGYAQGGLLDRLAGRKNTRLYACDVNERETPEGVTFIRADFNGAAPDFGGVKFDVVFAGEFIEHMYDDAKFLAEARDLLKPSGILALTTPNLFFLASRLAFPFGVFPFMAHAPFHYHYYDVRSLSGLLENAGLRLVKIRSSHILISTRMNRPLGRICEFLGDVFPSFGAHIIVFAVKK
ncbi:MAG: class I SAM-dependent methyltransferase [Nitrospinae bacterium]|nr:class I SAM-dependent methyltransferase [Nitrospinota bacterium]